MSNYPFALVQHGRDVADAKQHLANRPFIGWKTKFADEAQYFYPGAQLETAINTAIAVGEPLLITGETGTGKTQAAYYVAHKLGIESVLHFQVKSDTTARDLLYHFDAVRYFYEANVRDSAKVLDNGTLSKNARSGWLWKRKNQLCCLLMK